MGINAVGFFIFCYDGREGATELWLAWTGDVFGGLGGGVDERGVVDPRGAEDGNGAGFEIEHSVVDGSGIARDLEAR